MKDARGHGSNGRGGSGRKTFVMPSRPYRQSDENTAHQRAIASQHGVATDHLDSIRQSYPASSGWTWGRDPRSGQVTGFRKVVSDALSAGARLHANSLNGYDPRNKRG